jgi:putative endonuclease
MYHVYILISRKNGKRYTGFTSKHPEQRLIEHNNGSNTWTRNNGPFDLLYSECFLSRKAALKRELYMKSAAGRKFLKSLGAIA